MEPDFMPFPWRAQRTQSINIDGSVIPKSLHFLWGFLGDDGPLAEREQANFNRWESLNPDWDLSVHNPRTISAVAEDHPYQAIYDDVPTAIQRCDLARPFLLEKYGGVYSDLDVDPFQNLNRLSNLFPHASVLLIEEVTLTRGSSLRRGKRHAVRQGRPELRLRVANFWMASVPGHPFWQDVMELVQERADIPIQDDYDVIYTTGPDIISEVYHRTQQKYKDVALVPRSLARKFFRHRTHGSWRVNESGQRWVA